MVELAKKIVAGYVIVVAALVALAVALVLVGAATNALTS